MCHLPVFYGKLLGMESHLTRQTASCFSAVKLGQYWGGYVVKRYISDNCDGLQSVAFIIVGEVVPCFPFGWASNTEPCWYVLSSNGIDLDIICSFMLSVNYSMHLSEHSTLSWFPPNHLAGDRAGGCGHGSWLRRSLTSWKMSCFFGGTGFRPLDLSFNRQSYNIYNIEAYIQLNFLAILASLNAWQSPEPSGTCGREVAWRWDWFEHPCYR